MQEQNQHYLKTGSIVNHYKILRVLGSGGFGITYLAQDIQLGMKVVIKEYFPNEFALRQNDSTIVAKTSSKDNFKRGKERFKEEAQILAKFNHPSIVKILGYFEANDTAYFIMEYEEGIDLSQYLKQVNRALSQEEILSIIMPVLEGLKEVHKYKYLHRDIKPGNILLRDNKQPVLIDFGASKLVLGEVSKSVTSMLTEGYAPLEQYSTDKKQQGSFTDLYAVGAVMYKMITGEVPPSAQTRTFQILQEDIDPYHKLVNMSLDGYEKYFLQAIDKVLSVKAKDRQQTVNRFQEELIGNIVQDDSNHEIQDSSNSEKSSNTKIFLVFFLALLIGAFVMINSLNETQSNTITSNNPKDNNLTTEHVKETEVKSTEITLEQKPKYIAPTEEIPVSKPVEKIIEPVKIEKKVVPKVYTPTELCNNGQIEECFKLGQKYVKGLGVKKSMSKAKTFFVKACDGGSAEGCTNLGLIYTKGAGIKIDNNKATKYAKKGCRLGDSKGCFILGMSYMYGNTGVKKNKKHAREYFSKSCNGNYATGCTNLGLIYAKGVGVKINYKKALKYIKKGCTLNDAKGCFMVGEFYRHGQGGLKRNKKKAKQYFKKSCNLGYKKACKEYKKFK